MRFFVEPWMKMRVLPRENWVLAGTMLANRMGHMALPFLMLYLTQSRKWTPTEAGFMFTVYGVFSLAAALMGGHLADRFSPKRLMTISLVVAAAVIASIPYIYNYYLLVAAVGIWALAAESFRPANMALINLVTPAPHRKLAFSLHRFAINLGMSIGPVFGGYLAEVSFSYVFWVNAIALMIGASILNSRRFTKQSPINADAAEVSIPGPSLRAFQNPKFILFLLGIMCMHLIYVQHETTLPLMLAEDLHLATRYFGFTIAINTLMIVLLEIPLNARILHWKHRRSLMLGMALYGIGFGSLFFADRYAWVILAAVIWTFAEMIESPTTSAAVADFAPKNRIGEYAGMLTFAYSLSMIIGPWMGTYIYQHYQVQAVWIYCVVVAIFGSFVIFKATSNTR